MSSLRVRAGVAAAAAVAWWLWRRRRREVSGLPWIVAELQFGAGTHTEAEKAVGVATRVYDGRRDPSRFELHRSGFELVEAGAAAAVARARDLYDAETTVAELFPVAEAMVARRCPGATKVLAFDHIMRNPVRLEAEAAVTTQEHVRPDVPPKPPHRARQASEPPPISSSTRPPAPKRHPSLSLVGAHHSYEQASHGLLAALADGSPLAKLIREAARPTRTRFLQGTLPHAHGDYTARSGLTRARQLLAPYVHEAALDDALADRVAIVNVWIPLKRVASDPLAVCAWSSCGPRDVRTSRLVFPTRIGETYKVVPRPSQRWVFFSDMTLGEALLLKTFDTDRAAARFCLHTAFSLPGQLHHTRESLEIRVLLLYSPLAAGHTFFKEPFVPPHVATALKSHTEGLIEVPEAAETLPPSNEW